MSDKNQAITKHEGDESNSRLDMSAKVLATITGGGSLEELSVDERAQYIIALCNSMGLNPLSRPIELMSFKDNDGNLKTVPYAKKEASDALRKIHGISIKIVEKHTEGDIFMVTAEATDNSGRVDTDMGAVDLKDYKGNPLTGTRLANAFMKGITKAKRRVTLSIAGLGILDESEIEGVEAERGQTIAQRLGVSSQLPTLPRNEPSDPVAALIQTIVACKEDEKELDRVMERTVELPMNTKQRREVAAAFEWKRKQIRGATKAPEQKKEETRAEAAAEPSRCPECGALPGEKHVAECPHETPPPGTVITVPGAGGVE